MDVGALSRKGCLPALAALTKADPRPLSASEFVEATEMDAGAAIRLRNWLQESGVLIAEPVRQRGSVKEYEIRLTALGRDLAPHALAMADALRRHASRQARKRKPS